MCRESTSEHWAPIPGFEEAYEVSCFGRFRSLPRKVAHWRGGYQHLAGRLLHPGPNNRGTTTITLRWEDHKVNRFVHSIVAAVFVPNPLAQPCVLHLDDNRTHNWAGNLTWGDFPTAVIRRDLRKQARKNPARFRTMYPLRTQP
jgi:hypothetical protein